MSRPALFAILALAMLATPILVGCAAVEPTVTPVGQRTPAAGPHPTIAGSSGSTGPAITHVVKPTPAPSQQSPAIEVPYWLDEEVNRATNAFGLDLVQRMYAAEPGNIMISPVSLAMALGMTANGAVGDTQAGMLTALALDIVGMERANKGYAGMMQTYADPALPVTLAIANALWLDVATPFHDAYLLDTSRYYDAELTALPMNDAAVDQINAWVSKNTLGDIPSIISKPLSPATVLVLTNAIYFQGDWRVPFDPERTMARPFTLLGGGQIEAETMSRNDKLAIAAGGEGNAAYRVASLPYGDDGDLHMLLVLPDATDGLPDVLASLNADDLLAWDAALAEAELKTAYLALPKFDSDYEVTLNDTLAAMGMDQAFGGGADFSAMSPQGDRFFISLVKHKSSVTVDEEGTVAAAASAVVMEKGIAIERETFVCDRPFAYIIWDGHAKTALFAGVVIEP